MTIDWILGSQRCQSLQLVESQNAKRSVFAQKKALVGLVKYIIFRSIPLLSPLLSHYPSLPPLLSPWNDYYPTIIPLVSHYLSPALSPSLSYFDSRSKLSAELQLADAGDTCAAPFRSRRWSTWAHGARAHQRDGFGCYIRIYIVLYLYYIIFYLFILYLYSYYIIFYLYYILFVFILYFIYIKSYLYYIIFVFILYYIYIILYLYLYSIILYYIYIYIILYLYLYYIIFIFILYYIYYIIFVLYYINIILILYIIFVLYYIFIILYYIYIILYLYCILYYIYIILYIILYYIILYYIILYTFGTKNQQGWFTQNLKSSVIGTARFHASPSQKTWVNNSCSRWRVWFSPSSWAFWRWLVSSSPWSIALWRKTGSTLPSGAMVRVPRRWAAVLLTAAPAHPSSSLSGNEERFRNVSDAEW